MSSSAKVQWNQQKLERMEQRFVEGALDLVTTLAADCRDNNPGAPVKHGNLKASIRLIPTNKGFEIIAGGKLDSTWERRPPAPEKLANKKYGVGVFYARRQEFENPNGHQGYMRKPFERMFGNDNWKQKFFGRLAG